MINPEKRCEPRLAMQIPMRYRSLDLGNHRELPTDTQNISRTGLLMRSSDPLKIGSAIFLNLRVPHEISGRVFSEVQCTARSFTSGGCLTEGLATEFNSIVRFRRQKYRQRETVIQTKRYFDRHGNATSGWRTPRTHPRQQSGKWKRPPAGVGGRIPRQFEEY